MCQQQVAQHSSGEGADGPSASWAFESCAALAASRNESVMRCAAEQRRPSVLMHASRQASRAGILAF